MQCSASGSEARNATSGVNTNDLRLPINNGASIDRVSVKIPPFWRKDPEMWFAQVETQFVLAGRTSDETKFNHVAGNLDANYAT